jgi:hypothetical protein
MYMVSSQVLTLVGASHLRICRFRPRNWCMNESYQWRCSPFKSSPLTDKKAESERDIPLPVNVMRETGEEATRF